jgi:hypothetical protein
MSKIIDDVIQMGKGALYYGEEKMNELEQTEGFKTFDKEVKRIVKDIEVTTKEMKDDLMEKGNLYDKRKEEKKAQEANNTQNNEGK